jgi:hypothetical protein
LSDWLPTDDDLRIEGLVEVAAVRDADGRDGLRHRLVDPEQVERFDAFHDALDGRPGIHVLDRGPGWVVFADAPDRPTDVKRFAVRAVDAVEAVRGELTGLTAAEIACRDEAVHLRPVWRPDGGPPPLRAVGDHLRRLDAEALGDAIDALVDPEPEVRRQARTLLVGAPRSTSNIAVKYTTTATERTSRGAVDRVRPRGAIVLTAATLSELSPEQRSAAAGLAGLSLQAIAGLQAAGLPLVIETHRRTQDALQRTTQLRQRTGLPVEAAVGGGVMRPLFGVGLLVTAIATALGALSLALIGLVLLPVAGSALAVAMLALAAWMSWSWNEDRRLLDTAVQSEREAQEERERQAGDPDLARAWSALSEARAGLAEAVQLPSNAASDLRDVLKAAERELQQLAKANAVVRKGLGAASTEDVRARIASLDAADPSHARRRASLQATLAELEELEVRATRIAEDAHTLEAVLTEVASSIARWETDPEEPAMQAVIRATQGARSRARAVRA